MVQSERYDYASVTDSVTTMNPARLRCSQRKKLVLTTKTAKVTKDSEICILNLRALRTTMLEIFRGLRKFLTAAHHRRNAIYTSGAIAPSLLSPARDCVAMRQLTRLSFLSEAKNLTFALCCEIRDSSAAPQNDIATQSPTGEM